MTLLSEFWTIYGNEVLENIQFRGSTYWSQNVYRYYSHGTGKLGDSFETIRSDDQIIGQLKPMFSIQSGGLHEYGQDIVNGIPPGPGKYSPIKGYRLKVGQYPGVSVDKFWRPWMAEFEPVFRNIVREEVSSKLRDFTREQLTGGANE